MIKRYDVAVIGAGIAGLIAAAKLVKHGKQVVLIEKNHYPGGYCQTFRIGDFTFNTTTIGISELDGTGFVGSCLREFGLSIDYRPIPRPLSIYPDRKIINKKDLFTDDVDQGNFQRMIEDMGEISRLIAEEPASPKLMKYLAISSAEFIKQYFTDPKYVAVLSPWAFFALPPSEVPLLAMVSSLYDFQDEGVSQYEGYIPLGGAEQFPRSLASYIERNSGAILFKTKLAKLEVVGKRVQKAILADGSEVEADYFINTSNPLELYRNKIDPAQIPNRYRERLQKMQPSYSYFLIYLGLKQKLKDVDRNIELYHTYDIEPYFQQLAQGRIPEENTFHIAFPSLFDPGLAPPGKQTMIVELLCPYDYQEGWSYSACKRLIQKIIRQLTSIFPHLKSEIEVIDYRTPVHLAEISGNEMGCAYGFANTLRQYGPFRLKMETPFSNLFLAGHYVEPGGGLYCTSVSGYKAAEKVLSI